MGGKKTVAAFFVGKVMRLSKGQANPALLNELVTRKLDAIAQRFLGAVSEYAHRCGATVAVMVCFQICGGKTIWQRRKLQRRVRRRRSPRRRVPQRRARRRPHQKDRFEKKFCQEGSFEEEFVSRKYSPSSGKDVEREMKAMKQGKLKSGRSGKKVTNPKQAIAIGLSEARKEG